MHFIKEEELKKIELSILIDIDNICRMQGLRYSLGYGTLLGAVRHKGFIPWDDDIDILMPRPDYEQLIEYCNKNETKFELKSYLNDSKYWNLFSKACAKGTILEEVNCNRSKVCLGVYIDIFPIDGLGHTYKEAKKIFLDTGLKRELLNAAQWQRFFRSKTHAVYYEPLRLGMFIISRFISPNKLVRAIDKKCEENSFDKSQFCGCISSPYRLKEIMEKSIFMDYCDITFENYTFKAIKQYDAFLTKIYGNYMKLPPESKRITHHTFKAYYLTTQETN